MKYVFGKYYHNYNFLKEADITIVFFQQTWVRVTSPVTHRASSWSKDLNSVLPSPGTILKPGHHTSFLHYNGTMLYLISSWSELTRLRKSYLSQCLKYYFLVTRRKKDVYPSSRGLVGPSLFHLPLQLWKFNLLHSTCYHGSKCIFIWSNFSFKTHLILKMGTWRHVKYVSKQLPYLITIATAR